MNITITEALGEVPTIQKRLQKKQAFITGYLVRQAAIRDPHEKDGGSARLIEQELQSIHDLNERLITIRAKIQQANAANTITVGTTTRTIADWLTWRREVSTFQQNLLASMNNTIKTARATAMKTGGTITENTQDAKTQDFVVNVGEAKLASEIEELETILGTLDAQLSLKNATIVIDL